MICLSYLNVFVLVPLTLLINQPQCLLMCSTRAKRIPYVWIALRLEAICFIPMRDAATFQPL